jgi:hypothetical protein
MLQQDTPSRLTARERPVSEVQPTLPARWRGATSQRTLCSAWARCDSILSNGSPIHSAPPRSVGAFQLGGAGEVWSARSPAYQQSLGPSHPVCSTPRLSMASLDVV